MRYHLHGTIFLGQSSSAETFLQEVQLFLVTNPLKRTFHTLCLPQILINSTPAHQCTASPAVIMNHGIMEWLGLERTLRIIEFQARCHGQGTFQPCICSRKGEGPSKALILVLKGQTKPKPLCDLSSLAHEFQMLI